MLFQRKVNVGAKIVDPDGLRLRFGAGRTLIEENDVRLDTRLIEDARGQTQDCMQITGSKQLLAHDLASAALKEHVVRHDHRSLARGFQDGIDVLDEIELLVAAGGPEILTVIYEVFFLLFAFLIGEGEGGFFAEGRIGENVIHAIAGIGEQRIAVGDRNAAVDIPDVVQVQIHQAQLEGRRHQLISVEGPVFQEFLLLPIESIIFGISKEQLRREEESAAATAGVRDRFHRLRADAGDHRLDQRTGREILACAGFYVFCVFLQQALIDFSLHVRRHGDPFLPVDHLHDPVKDRGIADLVDRALEDLTQDAALFAELFQRLFILFFQIRPGEGVHILPCIAGRDTGLLPIWRLGILVRHLEEDQVCKLLQIISI